MTRLIRILDSDWPVMAVGGILLFFQQTAVMDVITLEAGKLFLTLIFVKLLIFIVSSCLLSMIIFSVKRVNKLERINCIACDLGRSPSEEQTKRIECDLLHFLKPSKIIERKSGLENTLQVINTRRCLRLLKGDEVESPVSAPVTIRGKAVFFRTPSELIWTT